MCLLMCGCVLEGGGTGGAGVAAVTHSDGGGCFL